MDQLTKLRESRSRPTVKQLEFLLKCVKNVAGIFCFVEGDDDSEYYESRVRQFFSSPVHCFPCGGKANVMHQYSFIMHSPEYRSSPSLFFIDRDFDNPVNDEGIYETPCYSIENLYTSEEVLGRILNIKFRLSVADPDYIACITLYLELQKQFHNAVLCLNAIIAWYRERETASSFRLNLKDVDIHKVVRMSLDGVTRLLTVSETLDYLCVPEVRPSEEEVSAKVTELSKQCLQKALRGKFEIEFLRWFLLKLQEAFAKGNGLNLNRRIRAKLSISKNTILADLSQHADLPTCLVEYLAKAKKRFLVAV